MPEQRIVRVDVELARTALQKIVPIAFSFPGKGNGLTTKKTGLPLHITTVAPANGRCGADPLAAEGRSGNGW